MATEEKKDNQEQAVPPYYERYQEEREKRYQSELHRVGEAIERNGRRIDELKEGMDRRFEEQTSWFKFVFGTIILGFIAILLKLFLG